MNPMTSSPTATFLTALPTASTTPARSLPCPEGNVAGHCFGEAPSRIAGLSRVDASRLHTDKDLFASRHRSVDLDDPQDVDSAIFEKLHRTRHRLYCLVPVLLPATCHRGPSLKFGGGSSLHFSLRSKPCSSSIRAASPIDASWTSARCRPRAGQKRTSARRSQCLLMTPKQNWSEHRNERHAHVWRCWKCDWICLTASCYVMR